MKKLMTIVMATVMLFALAAPVAASSSTETIAQPNGTVDANGAAIAVTVAAADVKIASEDAALVLGTETAEVVAMFDASVPAGTAFPVTLTFDVPGITAGMNVSILHFVGVEGDGYWEILPATVVDGQVTGVFSSLSPISVVVTDTAAVTSVTSPKTGEANVLVYLAFAVVAAAGVTVVARKRA
ncbi:MAG: LPXTG cell wall anchor domain-containing protein [Lachnospiraceae bacterium]